MIVLKTVIIVALVALVNSRSIRDEYAPFNFVVSPEIIQESNIEDGLRKELFNWVYPKHPRIKRQPTEFLVPNSDGNGFPSVDNDDFVGGEISVTKTHFPSVGPIAGKKVTLVKDGPHTLDGTVFTSGGTHGSSLDYMFNNQIGGSVGVSHTPLFRLTDISTMGNLNLYRDSTSSLDFNAGSTRTFSPYLPMAFPLPSFGFTMTRNV